MTVSLPEVGTPTVNSRWACDVNTGSSESPDWSKIRGINSFTPAVNNTVQDATDYDNEGWGSDAVTLRKWQIQMTVLRKEYSDAGGEGGGAAYDPGQEALREAADGLDPVHVRWYERGVAQGEAYEGFALVQWEPQGGDATGLGSVNVTLLGQGARTPISVPGGSGEGEGEGEGESEA